MTPPTPKPDPIARLLPLLLALLLASCAAHRQRETALVAVVPDKAFRNYLVNNGYAEKVHTFGRTLRPTAKGRALEEMACYEMGITSLRGIKMFPQLKTLVCSGNPITTLDLNCLPLLERLHGIHLPLRRIDIDSCHHLKGLELSYTQLTEFDLHPFPELTYFFCIFSPLTRIDLSPCPALKSVYIRGTQITDIDLTPCTDFFQLHATDTPLRTIRVTTEQYMGDIKVSCDDSVTLVVAPWKPLLQFPGRSVLLDEARAAGITLDTLETYYPSGMIVLGDSVPQGYMRSWMAFVQGLADALREADMDWTEPYRLWGRAFFAPDGSVDRYFYTWTGEMQPSDEWKALFRKVLENYLSHYRFTHPMHRRFAQCGGISLRPTE